MNIGRRKPGVFCSDVVAASPCHQRRLAQISGSKSFSRLNQAAEHRSPTVVLIFTRRWRSSGGRAGIDGGTDVPAVSSNATAHLAAVSARVDTYDAKRYTWLQMIRSFACPETEKLFNDESSRRLPTQIQRVARRKLLLLNQARSLNDLRVPYRNHLEALKDDRKGQHSIRVNDQWRICFRWHGEDAFDVEIVDYH